MRAKTPSAVGEVDPRVALRAFMRLADRWELARPQRARLLRVSEKSIARYEAAPPHDLDADKLERISYLLGIYRGVNTIFGDKSAAATDWLRLPNSAFGGMTPLDRMLAGNVGDLAFVRAYVDRQVDPW
jgi:hypothetical protein